MTNNGSGLKLSENIQFYIDFMKFRFAVLLLCQAEYDDFLQNN